MTSLTKRLKLTALLLATVGLAALPALTSLGQGTKSATTPDITTADTTDILSDATSGWDSLLKKHVQLNGGVDYIGLKQDQAQLLAFIESYGRLDPKVLGAASDGQKKALYINLYNATMIFNLLRHAEAAKIDVASPAFLALEINKIDVPGGNIWNGDYKVKLAGFDVNLDDIEHKLLRGKANDSDKLAPLKVKVLDPRLHAAVNCAALSCPRVREVAYTATTIDSMLEANINEWLSNNEQFKKLDDDTLQANSIVFWYYSDFDEYGQKTMKTGGAGDYLSGFIASNTPDAAWKIKHLKENFNDRGTISLKLSSAFKFYYDWHVNDRRNKK